MTADVLSFWPPKPDVSRAVAPGIRHLLAPNASSWTYEGTNSYVIASGDSAVLIDPGCEVPSHHEALRRAGREGRRTVTAVLLTHDHPDHSDGARTLAASLDVPIIGMSPRFADEFLSDGQVLRIGELDVHVVHTPGHSDDSICLWMPQQGTLLTGDTLLGARSSGVMGTLSELLGSLEWLRKLVGDREVLALPGHGPAFTDVVESATRVIDVRMKRIDEVRGHIADGVTTLEGLTRLLYPNHSGSKVVFAVSTVVSTVTYLLEQQGVRGIPDPVQRAAVAADVDRYEQQLAERMRAHKKEVDAEVDREENRV
ncbi:MBL fold metallo-hydrolase [Gryllotalpicola koreensis]|uniref:MBL fold metallo-hydrolase n=2 Tax=Gryllotalpicola koreensis TaxID=993086 RepID=A0ABP7ZRP4_9MICO